VDFAHHGLRTVLRLTDKRSTRHHQRVELEDIIGDVEREYFAVIAAENVDVVPQYDHTIKRSAET